MAAPEPEGAQAAFPSENDVRGPDLTVGDEDALEASLEAQDQLHRELGYKVPDRSAPPSSAAAPINRGADGREPHTTNRGGRAQLPRAKSPATRHKSGRAGKRHQKQVLQTFQTQAPPMPRILEHIFARPSVLPGQKGEELRLLHEEIRRTLLTNARSRQLSSADCLGEMWAYDIASAFWDVMDLRRAKAQMMRRSARSSLAEVLSRHLPDLDYEERRDLWGTTKPRRKARKVLKDAGLSVESINAQSLVDDLDMFRLDDDLITRAERRRNNAIREFDRHDAACGRRLREFAQAIDAEAFAPPPLSGSGTDPVAEKQA